MKHRDSHSLRKMSKSEGADPEHNCASAFRKLTMPAAVEAVNSQPDQQPSEEPQPRKNWKTAHQQHAEEHAQYWRNNSAWSTEGTMPVRIFVTQDDYPEGHEDERK